MCLGKFYDLDLDLAGKGKLVEAGKTGKVSLQWEWLSQFSHMTP